MKIKRILLCTFAAAAVCACQKEKMNVETPVTPEYKVSFVANTESDNASKAVIGTNASGKIQTFWENGDKVSVYSDGNGALNEVLYPFETSLTTPSASAVFGYNNDDFEPGEHYLAIYPHTEGSGRAANFTNTRMAQVDVPANQKLVAGSYDRDAVVMLAYSDNLNTLNFKNAVALVKFKVADENVKSGSITAKAANIVGRFRGDVKLSEDGSYSTELVEYASGSAYKPSPTLSFSVEGDAALAVGTDYYVAVRPVALEEGFSVYLDGEFIKTYYITEFKRNTIYDLGTLSLPEPEEGVENGLTLSFDFTTCPAGWPTATTDSWANLKNFDSGCKTDNGGTATDNPHRRAQVTYTIDGVGYDFTLADPDNASAHNIFYGISNGGVYVGSLRYFGLPAIEGKRLVAVEMVQGASNQNPASFTRNVGVTENIGDAKNAEVVVKYVKGGESQNQAATNGVTYRYELEGTEENTVYYLDASTKASVIKSLKLTYEDAGVTVKKNSVRIGTYNLRYINNNDAEENQWENRKGRVKQSILDNDFDIFAVQECSAGIKTYLESELSSVYSGNYFSPYAGNSSKEEYIALLYKKDKFTLSDWQTFWLADDISKINSVSEPNDASGEYSYYRGGCCAVLTEIATNKKMFVISTHGCLGAEYRARYAGIYAEVEKKYNTGGYPAFLLGDMNSRPTDAASVEYRKYWNDVYRSVAPDMIAGPFATYNAFDLDRDLNADTKRLDYIYYRNATPLNYVCNSKKYDGLYASDHLPVYADMVLP